MQKYIEMTFALKTVSESNVSEHWAKKGSRHRIQKRTIWAEFLRIRPVIILPTHIKLTRYGKRLLDDDDNLRTALKWVKDAIADQIIPGKRPGQADSDKRLTWEYAQTISKNYLVGIEFFRAD